MREVYITPAEENQRLDKFLLKYMNSAPKTFIYKMLRKKNIVLNGGRADGGEKLVQGDCVKLFLSDETIEGFRAAKILNQNAGGVSIVYEDADVLVCDKPQGVLSHPETAGDRDTMIDRILLYLWRKGEADMSGEATFTPALCNRLDRNTSGVVVCGKTLAAVQWLNRAIAGKKVDKGYKALVSGHIMEAGTLTGFHWKDAGSNTAVISETQTENAREVTTIYKPIRWKNGFTVVDITLVTGRSHQIRAHFSAMGHPIVGDVKYGDPEVNALFRREAGVRSQLLHAERVTFTETEGVLGALSGRTFTAPPPSVFRRAQEWIFREC